MMAGGFAGVLFDMDGLLLDSERIFKLAWRAAIEDLDFAWDEDFFHSLIGLNSKLSRQRLQEFYGPDDRLTRLPDRVDHHFHKLTDDAPIPVKPGVHELLDLLDHHDVPRAVATSTKRGNALAKLERSGLLHRFHGLVGGDEVTDGKPSPEPFRKAAALLEVEADRCLALEDSFNGIRAAHAAGATPVMVPDLLHPTPEIRALAHRIAPSLLEVRDWLLATPDAAHRNRPVQPV
jgi:HAD superfamily hydrolase (TIGR01509 family)